MKGVVFRRDGLAADSAAYLESKLKRARKREREAGSPLHGLLRLLLPAGYARVPVESLVSGRILVVGCAGGVETLGLRAVGLDVDRHALRIAVDLARQAVDARASFLAASGADLPFRGTSFDSVLSDNVVEHIPGTLLPRHLEEVRRVLAPGGRYVFTTPNRLFENPPKEGHISLHSYAEWEALARGAGFSAIETPRRRSGPLGGLTWKKEREASSGLRLGLSHRGLRMVTIVATA